MLSTTSTVFVPGWRKIGKLNGAIAVVPAGRLVVLDAVDHAAEIGQAAPASHCDKRRSTAHNRPH